MAESQTTAVAPTLAFARSLQRDNEQRFVLEFLEKSDRLRQPFMQIWREIQDNYMVRPYGDRIPFPLNTGTTFHFQRRERSGMSRLKDPETHQIVETLTAQALGLLFSSRDYIQAVPLGSDDYEKARLVARLLMAILESPGQFRTHYQLFKDAFIYGTSILEVGWETRTRTQLVPRPLLDPSGQLVIGEQLVPDEVTYRDMPLIRQVQHWDFYPDPSGTRIQLDMQGVAKRFRITRDHARELAKAGVYESAGVEKAIRLTDERNSEPAAANRAFEELSQDTVQSFGMMTGFEYWGRVPFKTADGVSNRVITLLNGEVVRSTINPFIDGAIPFKEITVNPVSGRFYGLSPAEVVRYLQDSSDNLLMVFNDAADMAVRGSLLVGGGFGGDPNRLKERRVNDIINCADPSQVLPFPVDLSALSFAAQEMTRRKLTMREATGVTNPLQAIPTSDRQTATEVSELVRLASQKIEMMVTLIERDDYPWIGRTIHSRLRQFGSEGGFIATLAGEPFSVAMEQVNVESDIRFVGSRQAQSRLQKVAALREAINVLGTAAPQLLMTMPEVIVRYLRDGLDIVDGEAIVKQAVLSMAMQMAQAQGQMGAGAQSPNASSPETFGTGPGETQREGQAIA